MVFSSFVCLRHRAVELENIRLVLLHTYELRTGSGRKTKVLRERLEVVPVLRLSSSGSSATVLYFACR
jgi:hypothetical protein